MKYDPVYYGDYLKLDNVLDSQKLMSEKYKNPAHDEMLFIIIHQTYELWFKQILHELDSVHELFCAKHLDPGSIATATHRLNRITEIQRVLNDQITIIETMKPQDFMEFRDYLVPASGFQSIQFRQIELKLGLKQRFRLQIDKEFFNSRLAKADQERMLKLEEDTTLLELIDAWLSRMPFGKSSNYNFWDQYQETINDLLDSDEEIIKNNTTLNDIQKKIEVKNLMATRKSFEILFDDNQYQKLLDEGFVRISRQAKLSAIFIKLFKEEPILQMPSALIEKLIDIDEHFTTWRHRHVIMVHRMLGSKIGTGGSSGHDYLKKTTENNKIFTDFFDIATFLLPKSKVPKLPADMQAELGFIFKHE